MPELRKDPIVGRWVIVAANRAERPNAFLSSPRWDPTQACPFCEGREAETPGEIFAARRPGTDRDGPGWRVRVVPNKFPALVPQGNPDRSTDGMYDLMPGIGAHEVIIESPRHLVSTSELSIDELREVFWIYRERLLEWKRDPRLVYGLVFKNVGAAAGASLEHTHSQLIVTPIVPVVVGEEIRGSLEFHRRRDACVYCEMMRQELAAGQRIVLETPGMLAFCPFAGRFPYETWVLPKHHASHYETSREETVGELAAVMKRVIEKIEAALGRPAYNYLIHTAPFDTSGLGHYHWHIEVIPSLTRAAGFEWGSGFHVNPVPPEQAAAILREV